MTSTPASRRLLLWAARPAVALAVLGLWIGYVTARDLPAYVLPHPFDVVRTFVKLTRAGILPRHALFTGQAVLLGFGLTSKVLIAALICFFPLLVNVIIGFRSVGDNEQRLFRALGASAWQTFVRLSVPSALPFIFAGLRITSILAVIGAVVGEFVGSPAGLGYLAVTAAGNLDTEVLFSAVLTLMLMGLGFYLVITLVERRVLHWHESARR